MNKSRAEALALLHEYTKSDSLIKHALGVEAAMRWYARSLGQDELLWCLTGLLHDFDYEKYPSYSLDGPRQEGHPFSGCYLLRELGYPEEMITAILGHATYSGVSRETPLARHLFACDELSGLVTAAVLVRPDRSLHTIEPKSVRKKMKDKAFAKGVSREDILLGCQEIGLDLDVHIANVIAGMRECAEDLGLGGTSER